MTHTRPGWWPPDEDALLAETNGELPGEDVLAAGIFTLEAMIDVAAAAGAAGGFLGATISDQAVSSTSPTRRPASTLNSAAPSCRSLTVRS